MSSPYRVLLARPGARPLLAASGIAWLSYSVYGLGFVLVVQHGTGSFSTAGGVIAAFSAGSAALAPLRGRAVDRSGRHALLALATVHIGVLLALVAGAGAGAHGGALILLGALGGATAPPLIAVARAHWTRTAGSADLARSAHGLNAALSEGAQVIGPLVVAVVAGATADPSWAVGVLLLGVLLAAGLLARGMSAVRTRESPRAVDAGAATRGDERSVVQSIDRARTGARAIARVRWRPGGNWQPPGGAGFAVVVAGELLLAVGFGALDVALPAVADRDTGSAAGAAIPLAVLAAASAAAALWAGVRGARFAARERFVAGLGLGAIGLALVAIAPGPAAVAVSCVPAGAGIGLGFAAVLELLDDLVDERRAVEAFTWLTAAGGAGAAAGAAIASGMLARVGVDHAMLVAPAAAGLAALLAMGGRSRLVALAPASRGPYEPACDVDGHVAQRSEMIDA